MQRCERISGRRGASLAAYRDPLITSTCCEQVGRNCTQFYSRRLTEVRTEQAMPAGGAWLKPLTRRLAQGAAWSASPERARAGDQRLQESGDNSAGCIP